MKVIILITELIIAIILLVWSISMDLIQILTI